MIQKLFVTIFAVGFLCSFSFNEKWARYPRPDEILLLFQDRFPLGFERIMTQTNQCRTLTAENRAFLGDNRPDDGKPLVSEPNLHFVKWYTSCLAEAVANEIQILNNLQNQAAPETMDPAILAWIPAPENPAVKEEFLRLFQRSPKNIALLSNSAMSTELREHIVAQTLIRLIGPDVAVNEKPPFFSAKVLRARILKNIQAVDFSPTGFESMGFGKKLAGNESTILGYLAVTMLITSLQDEFLIQ